MKGRRWDGRGLLSARVCLWLAKRGNLDQIPNLSLPQNPVWDEDSHSDATPFIPGVGALN